VQLLGFFALDEILIALSLEMITARAATTGWP
jgi:hypothetical protein